MRTEKSCADQSQTQDILTNDKNAEDVQTNQNIDEVDTSWSYFRLDKNKTIREGIKAFTGMKKIRVM